jgi:hypothetical protein
MKQLQVDFDEVDGQMLIKIKQLGENPTPAEIEFCEITAKMTKTTCRSILGELSGKEKKE